MLPDNNSKPDDAEVEALSAYVDAIAGQPEIALSLLAGRGDPESIARSLAILVSAKRYREAAELVKNREPDRRWAELAVHSFAGNGDLPIVRHIVSWSKSCGDCQ
jgi:hypothetical protein